MATQKDEFSSYVASDVIEGIETVKREQDVESRSEATEMVLREGLGALDVEPGGDTKTRIQRWLGGIGSGFALSGASTFVLALTPSFGAVIPAVLPAALFVAAAVSYLAYLYEPGITLAISGN